MVFKNVLVQSTLVINPSLMMFHPTEVFALLGIGRMTGYTWLHNGRIKAIKMEGGKRPTYLVTRSEVERLLGLEEKRAKCVCEVVRGK